MTSIMAWFLVGILGTSVFWDGISSLWYYLNHKGGESWRKNHSLRLIRCAIGITLAVLAGMNLGG